MPPVPPPLDRAILRRRARPDHPPRRPLGKEGPPVNAYGREGYPSHSREQGGQQGAGGAGWAVGGRRRWGRRRQKGLPCTRKSPLILAAFRPWGGSRGTAAREVTPTLPDPAWIFRGWWAGPARGDLYPGSRRIRLEA
ncbi:hypothetical protein GCM10012279_57830 [Micromonospora yangpuensis]|nr:hypothetical protein GCM10012279_57830 [Micromonospora yangpuensis]